MKTKQENSGLHGVRVVRGPDWRWRNQDGGEGFVGTVIEKPKSDSSDKSSRLNKILEMLNSERFTKKSLGWISVLWDCGTVARYRIGLNGSFDLRIVDNSAIGVSHNVVCGQCCFGDIKGIRWLCEECGTNLCSSCYFNEKHEPRDHTRFQRFDTPDCVPVSVLWDPSATTVQLNGIFAGARVRKGRHWESGNDDVQGNHSGIGLVVPSYTLKPGMVQVKWPNNNTFPYRVGAEGKVDLLLEKHASGGKYVPENLPVLKSKYLDVVTKADGEIKFAVGDKVLVYVAADQLKSLQDGHGGWASDMTMIVGQEGVVRSLAEVGIQVDFVGIRSFWINPAALARLGPFSIGQPVRVKNDPYTTNSMELHITSQEATKIAGETGHVQRCHDGNNVEVVMDDFQKEQSVYLLKDSWLEILPVQESVNNKLNKLKKKIMTLLVNAAAEGQLIVLKDLFRQYRLGVNDQAEKGRTALQSACQRGQMEIIEWLVERKADVNLKDDKGRAAIHHAAKRCYPSVLTFLIKHGALLNEKDKKDFTPLQLSTFYGCKICIGILIENGCDTSIQDSVGDTALNNAIIIDTKEGLYRDHEILYQLISKSDLTIKNNKGYNSLLLAAITENRRALKAVLLKSGEELVHEVDPTNKCTALGISCYLGDYLSVKLFLEYTKSKGTSDFFLEKHCKLALTPLLLAAYKGRYDVVEYLVKNNANVTVRDEDGDSAAHLVAMRLENIEDKPMQSQDSEIYSIYEELLINCPEVVGRYPGFSLLCYLVRKGCPWKKTFSRGASKFIYNEEYRNILMAYCNEEDFEDADNLSQPCILCGSTGLTSCIIEDCGHSCALICTKCVSLVKNCPDCHRRNKAYGRKQKSEGDIGIFSDLTYNKNISQPSTNPAALSNRADDQHTARQKAYKRGYPKREIQTTDPFYFSQPSTSQQFEYGQQHNNPIYPYLYSYPYAYPYGHPNDDPSIENDDPATSTNHGAYQGNQ